MESLEKLFGSAVRLKLIKLFLYNPKTSFTSSEAASRVRVGTSVARKEIDELEKAELVKKVRSKKGNTNSWTRSATCGYAEALETFLTTVESSDHKDLANKISKAGKIQLLFLSGFFIRNTEARVDMFIVGDNLNKSVLSKVVSSIESEMGREIRYAFFSTADFKYRYSMFDKLIRDVLDFPHKKIVNKIGI